MTFYFVRLPINECLVNSTPEWKHFIKISTFWIDNIRPHSDFIALVSVPVFVFYIFAFNIDIWYLSCVGAF